jgi:hypothetical protein
MSYHAVAEVPGIEEPRSNVELIDIVRHGLPSEGVTVLSNKLGIYAV